MNFSPDRPIQRIEDDALGREPFVRSIESAIRGWKDKESLVIAITGPWGSGKSSVKHMVKDCLADFMGDTRQIIEFNPWQWAGQERLAEAFFREIEIALEKSPSPDIRKVAALWRLYAARLQLGAFISDRTSQAIAVGLGFALGSGATWSFFADHPAVSILSVFGLAAILVGLKVIPWISELVSRWSDIKGARVEVCEQSLEDAKKALRKQLEEFSKPIVVIVDDIDRLTADQIGYLFQLVKANADFPNLVYVLLMESRIVERSLDSITAGNGKDYLGKIVQVQLPLPLPGRSKIIGILEREVLALIHEPVPLTGFEEREWASAFIVFSPLFRTLRDVNRFINVLAFDISVLRGKHTLSVNVVDLVGLVALKVLHEKVYHQLPGVKYFLTRCELQGKDDEKVKHARESVFSVSSEGERDLLRPLLTYLFPSFPWEDDHLTLRGFNEDKALRNLRVHHPKNFDRYFVYSIGEHDISPEDFNQLINALPSRDEVRAYLREHFQRGVHISVFERLMAYIDKLEPEHGEPLLTALFDISDEYLPEWPSDERRMLDRFYWAICNKLVMRVEDPDQRLQIFAAAIENTTGLYLPVSEVSLEEPDSNRRSLGLSDEQLQPLHALCVRKIQEWAADGRLIKHSSLGFLLLRWQKWAESTQWKEWIVAQTETKEGLLAICSSFLGYTTSTEGTYVRAQLDLLDKLVDISLLEKKLGLLEKAQLTEQEAEALNPFFRALQDRGENGRSDEGAGD